MLNAIEADVDYGAYSWASSRRNRQRSLH